VIIEAAPARARNFGRAAIVVLDRSGDTISMDRVDGASDNVECAAGKARIAVMEGQRSSDTARLLETAPTRYYGFLSLYPGQVYLQSGGVPLGVDGRLVGAVGVSGLPGQSEQAADAGVEAWERYRQTLAR
jgi:glc operon protein GlcG